jgi:site-specific DNA recombinase
VIHTNGQQQAAIYARVSTTDQADKGYSLPQQIDACLAMAQQGGYTVPESHILADDYTGVSLHRPQLMKLRTLVQHQLIHAVFVYDLDRLSRKLAHQLMLCEEMDTCGVSLHVVAMPHNDRSPEAQLFSNIRGSFHEYERTRILKRTRDGLVGRSKAGFPPGGTVPLGYTYVRYVDKGGHYEVHPEEAAIVTRIFRLYVTEGCSLKAIAAQLSAEHIPTRADRSRTQAKRKYGAGTWYENTVSRILGNTAYIGTLHWGKRQR